MLLCRVVGNAISSHSHPSLKGFPMLLCQREEQDGTATAEPPFIAIDLFGAALHQQVFVSTDGIAARGIVHDDNSPVRNYVQGLVNE